MFDLEPDVDVPREVARKDVPGKGACHAFDQETFLDATDHVRKGGLSRRNAHDTGGGGRKGLRTPVAVPGGLGPGKPGGLPVVIESVHDPVPDQFQASGRRAFVVERRRTGYPRNGCIVRKGKPGVEDRLAPLFRKGRTALQDRFPGKADPETG